jgi:hypothetical protein
LVAQDSDHITHLIGPFRGDVRQKLQMGGAATYSVKIASIRIWAKPRRCGSAHRCNDIHKCIAILQRREEKGISRVHHKRRSEVSHRGIKSTSPRSVLVLVGSKCGNKKSAYISTIRWYLN